MRFRWPWDSDPDQALDDTYEVVRQAVENRAELRAAVKTLHSLLMAEANDAKVDLREHR